MIDLLAAMSFCVTGCVAAPVGDSAQSTEGAIEYRVDPNSGANSDRVIGFARGDFYDSVFSFPYEERIRSEFRAALNVRVIDGAIITDRLPIFVPSRTKREFSGKVFSCTSTELEDGYQVRCTYNGANEVYSAKYNQVTGFEWFEMPCAALDSQPCRFIPVSNRRLFPRDVVMAIRSEAAG